MPPQTPQNHGERALPWGEVQAGVVPNMRWHAAVAAAPRCMQEMCWFTPARAYALGLYIDEGALSRAVVRGAWTREMNCRFIV